MLGVQTIEIEKRMMSVQLPGQEGAFLCAHYLMLAWLDHAAPSETDSIQELIRAVNSVCLLHCLLQMLGLPSLCPTLIFYELS
jgi:hypothetical protein